MYIRYELFNHILVWFFYMYFGVLSCGIVRQIIGEKKGKFQFRICNTDGKQHVCCDSLWYFMGLWFYWGHVYRYSTQVHSRPSQCKAVTLTCMLSNQEDSDGLIKEKSLTTRGWQFNQSSLKTNWFLYWYLTLAKWI